MVKSQSKAAETYTKLVRSNNSKTNKVKLLVSALFVFYNLTLATIGTLRLYWAFPDAPWLSNLIFIDDINKLLEGNFGQVTWFQIGGIHSLNGYRWFEYFSALFWGFDSRVELIFYFALTSLISILVGLTAISQIQNKIGFLSIVSLFLIPPTMMSLVSAGSRGMELGTYTGVVLVVLSFFLTTSKINSKKFALIIFPFALLVTFVFLGGYIAGGLIAFVGMACLQQNKFDLYTIFSNKFTIGALAFLLSGVLYFISIQIGIPEASESGLNGLLSQITADNLFPIKFIFFGFVAGLASSSTLEIFNQEQFEIITLLLGTLNVSLCIFAIWISRQTESLREKTIIPLMIIFSAIGMMLMLMLGRNSGAAYLLSPWYVFHFKLLLVASLWMITVSVSGNHDFSKIKKTIVFFISSILLFCLVVALTFVNIRALDRHQYERAYFLNIAIATLFPSTLVPNESNGLTQLQLNLFESKKASKLLQENNLSIFRSPNETIQSLYGSVPDSLLLGEVHPNSIVGKGSQIIVISEKCKNISLNFDIAGIIDENNLRISTPNNDFYSTIKSSEPMQHIVDGLRPNDYIRIEFSESVTPAEQPQVNLSSKLSYECFH